MHGNEPSKGAKIDAELQAEEQEELKQKGKAWTKLITTRQSMARNSAFMARNWVVIA